MRSTYDLTGPMIRLGGSLWLAHRTRYSVMEFLIWEWWPIGGETLPAGWWRRDA